MIQAKIPIYEKLVGDMGVTSVEIADGFALQRWHCKFSSPQAKRHEVEHVLGSWVTYARNFLNFAPHDQVWFEHEPPADPALLTDYTEVFGCEVLFNQPASGLRIKESELDVPLPQANEKLLEMLLEHATRLLAEITQHHRVSDQVKSLLRLMLKQQTPVKHSDSRKAGHEQSHLAAQAGGRGHTLQRCAQ
jgi:hypothetical protein